MARIVKSGGTLGVPAAKPPSFGTLGAGVSDAWGNVYAMSCSHVLAAPGGGSAAGAVVESPAQPGQQPGSETIGSVYRWTGLGPGDNFVDAALALVSVGVQLSNAALALSFQQTAIHQQVPDFARYYGHTARVHTARGELRGRIGHVYDHKIFTAGGRDYSFSSVLAYDALDGPFEAGDSGSAVVEDTTGEFLGIHFAADDNGQAGYCILSCLIWRDFSAFALQFVA